MVEKNIKEKKSNNMTNKFLMGIVVVLVVVILAVAYIWIWGGSYWGVYMNTGELYFGQMSNFPSLALTDVYLLQSTGDESNPFAINRFDKSMWKPVDKIYLNESNVVWKSKVAKDSQLLEFFANPDKFAQPAGNSETAPQSIPTE